MYRQIFLASTAVMLVSLARPAEKPVIRMRGVNWTLDAASHRAAIRYRIINFSWKPMYVYSDAGLSPVVVEHQVGGRWLLHRKALILCGEGLPWGRLGKNDRCTSQLDLTVPGRYRLRAELLNNDRRTWHPVVGEPFRVQAPLEVAVRDSTLQALR